MSEATHDYRRWLSAQGFPPITIILYIVHKPDEGIMGDPITTMYYTYNPSIPGGVPTIPLAMVPGKYLKEIQQMFKLASYPAIGTVIEGRMVSATP
jgi:hypothetical protein